MERVHHCEKYPLLLAVFLLIPFVIIKSERWRYLLEMQKIKYSFKDTLSAYSASMFWGLATPGRIGDFLKAVYLKKNCRINISLGLSSVIVDRFLDLAVLLSAACLGVFLLRLPFVVELFILVMIGAYLFMIIILLQGGVVGKINDLVFRRIVPEKYFCTFSEKIDTFFQGMLCMKSFKIVIPLGVSFMAYAILYLQSFLLSQSAGIPIDFLKISLFISLANLLSLIPLTICGIGIRDVALISLFHNENLPAEMALSFSLLFLLVSNLGAMIIGLVAWLKNPISV